MKRNLISFSVVLLVFTFSQVFSQETQRMLKPAEDDNSKYTDVGNIGVTITNFGMYGHGFSLWPDQPSCEYPLGSGIEHIFDGGLWIGGYVREDPNNINSRRGPYVSTGAVDAASVSTRGGGFEFTNDAPDLVTEKSSLLDSPFYSPDAVSHQDFVMTYDDTSVTYLNGEPIIDHSPLGLEVHHESYAWNYPFADFFVIMNYWIKNVSDKPVDSVFVGLWTDTVVRNTNVTSPRTGSSFFNKGGNGFSDSLNMAYEFDAAGDVGFTDSYVGIQFLGSSVQEDDSVRFVTWQFRNTDDIKYFTPTTDAARYNKMNGFFSEGITLNPTIRQEIKQASNRSMLISAGPYTTIAPGDSINVVYAIVAAKKVGPDHPQNDTEAQKEELYNHGGWALRAYFGEDRNSNGQLDPGEDLDGDGEITRYVLPAPPKQPVVKVVPGNNHVDIYWDKRAEASIDPISGKMDFEGYRIYRTNAGFDLTRSQDLNQSLVKIAEFDSADNQYGLNTGFAEISSDEVYTFPDDPNVYHYKFTIDNLLNGWQYVYAVTAFDEGDPENELGSLESSKIANASRVLPGTKATSEEEVEVGVYPNPYYGNAYWDGPSERLRKIYFYNLPQRCEITIYTLAGDIVTRLDHDENSDGSELRWFQTYSSQGGQKMAGGEHAWDLITDADQAIATGLYLFTVKDLDTGYIKEGKFLVVK